MQFTVYFVNDKGRADEFLMRKNWRVFYSAPDGFVTRHHHMPDLVYNYSRICIAQILQPGRNLFFSLKENDSNRNRKHQRSSFFFHLNLLLWAYDFNNSLRLNENFSFPLTFQSEQRVYLPFSILCFVKYKNKHTHCTSQTHVSCNFNEKVRNFWIFLFFC